jgi:signal transduction histidine kinase
VAAQILMLCVGMTGLECIDILRAYAAGEARWSRAGKEAIIDLDQYFQTRDAKRFADFERNLSVMTGDRAARMALERTPRDIAAAERGFLQGENDARDVSAMAWGFVWFHNVPAFARSIDIWRNTDVRVAALRQTGEDVRTLGLHHGTQPQWDALRSRMLSLDHSLTSLAAAYSVSMGHASRLAKGIVAAIYCAMAALTCAFFVWRMNRMVNDGDHAENRVIEHQQRLTDFVSLASDWFCELDAQMRVSFVSANFEAPDLPEQSQLIGQYWLDALGAAGLELDGHDAERELTALLRGHTPFQDRHVKRIPSDGRVRYWSVAGRPREIGGRFTGYRISATDITAFVDTQIRLAAARDEAERANRAKSAFVANMGHELRTPLNAILGFSELIERQHFGDVGNPHYLEYARDIGTAGQHLLSIINGLLDHARIESGKLQLHEQAFDLAEAIRAVELLCGNTAAKNSVQLMLELPPDLPPIFADELRIRQSLINLVSNAVKFSPGGMVEISASCAGTIVIAVRDTGIGMTREELDHALEPFGQVDNGLNRKFEGTGLGLPLTKGLIALHGGTLTIDSAPAKGTRVTITLPSSRIVTETAAAVA